MCVCATKRTTFAILDQVQISSDANCSRAERKHKELKWKEKQRKKKRIRASDRLVTKFPIPYVSVLGPNVCAAKSQCARKLVFIDMYCEANYICVQFQNERIKNQLELELIDLHSDTYTKSSY